MRARFAAVTSRALDDDPRLTVLLADISEGLFAPAMQAHPTRVINLGIREQLLIGATAGFAQAGMRPIAHTYAPFLIERAFEQVKLDLGHQDLGAVLVSTGASYDAAREGRTHQSPGDVALLDTLPGWTVIVPGHEDEMEVFLRDAIAGSGRVYVRLSEQSNATPRAITPGRFTCVRRGDGATIIAVGPMLDRTLEAVQGLDVNVLYATTVRPFDAATLCATLAAPEVVLVEPYLAGTSIAEVSCALAHIPHRTLGLGVSNTEVRRYGTSVDHDRVHGLDVASLRARIKAFVSG